MSFNMDSSDMIGLFLEEAEEQLQKLDEGLLQLENSPDDLEVVKEIFRAAHTLKGSSATVGLTQISELTHAMENLLDCVRSGSVQVTTEQIDLLLKGTDLLRQMVDQVSHGEKAEADTVELVQSLSRACVESSDSASIEAKAEPETMGTTKNMPAVGASEMAVILKIADDCTMPSVRAFMVFNTLGALGDIVSANPPQDSVDSVQAGQEINIVLKPSAKPKDILEELGRISEVTIVGHSAIPDKDETSQSQSTAEPERKLAESGSESVAKSIQTVRVGVDRLDTLMNLVAELVIGRTRVSSIENELALKYENEELVDSLAETALHIARVVTELQEHIMKVRLLPVEQVFNRFPRMVRDLAHRAGKEVEFVLEGQETELDRSILEAIVDPLTHLLRNAVDHGIEPPDQRIALGKPRKGRVVLAAKQEENRIIIEVEDDGRGIPLAKVKEAALKKGVVGEETLARMSDQDALQLIFASGVSTAEKITDVSGRGVGMDVVRNNIQNLSGTVEVLTEEGKGSKFRINLPLTLAIIQALIVGVDDQVFVIPLSAVVETFRCDESEVRYIDSHPAINFRGSVLHLVELGTLMSLPPKEHLANDDGSITFVVVRTGSLKIGLVVDRLIGEQEVVIKSLGSYFGDIKGIAGATILGDGRVALIIDVGSLGGVINRRKVARNTT